MKNTDKFTWNTGDLHLVGAGDGPTLAELAQQHEAAERAGYGFTLRRINPKRDLNSRQKENFNFMKISAVLADYGFNTIRLSDDWQGADFIAQHIDGEAFLKIQLKARLTFDKKYLGKGIFIVFADENADWYLYPHDALFNHIAATKTGTTKSWKRGTYSYPKLSNEIRALLAPFNLGSTADNPTPAPLPA